MSSFTVESTVDGQWSVMKHGIDTGCVDASRSGRVCVCDSYEHGMRIVADIRVQQRQLVGADDFGHGATAYQFHARSKALAGSADEFADATRGPT